MPSQDSSLKTIFVTGGAGFIGSCLIRHCLKNTDFHIVNIDKLTYAGDKSSLGDLLNSPRHSFEEVDILDGRKL